LCLFAALIKLGLGALPDGGNVLQGGNRAANLVGGISQWTGVARDDRSGVAWHNRFCFPIPNFGSSGSRKLHGQFFGENRCTVAVVSPVRERTVRGCQREVCSFLAFEHGVTRPITRDFMALGVVTHQEGHWRNVHYLLQLFGSLEQLFLHALDIGEVPDGAQDQPSSGCHERT
jgi:hypothetical protein